MMDNLADSSLKNSNNHSNAMLDSGDVLSNMLDNNKEEHGGEIDVTTSTKQLLQPAASLQESIDETTSDDHVQHIKSWVQILLGTKKTFRKNNLLEVLRMIIIVMKNQQRLQDLHHTNRNPRQL
jgi:hypothetical protein